MEILISFIVFVFSSCFFVLGINEGWGSLIFIFGLILGLSAFIGIIQIVDRLLISYFNVKK